MPPRLLPKSEVAQRQAEEQRQSIEEGMKVAERVDTLREVHASEEAALIQYRNSTLEAIKKDIAEVHATKESLEQEVLRLRREREELLKPLAAEWEEVNASNAKCVEWNDRLSTQDSQLQSLSETLKTKEREIGVQEGRAEDLKKLASAMFTQAESTVAKAKEDAADMRNRAQAELSLIELRDMDLRKLSTSITSKEQAFKEKEARVEKYEEGLMKRELALREGWRNLEQTAQRLKL